MNPEPTGSTPLDEDEAADLIPTHLVSREDLNAWEQVNIAQAVRWLGTRKREPRSILDTTFLFDLHRRMFSQTWRWAGKQRATERNIGVAPGQIAEGLRNLMSDALFWIERGTYGTDELATRFHHRLVVVHAFANGNGRHARLATDLLVLSLGGVLFSWGSGDLDRAGEARSRYLRALRRADGGSFGDLLTFVRS